MGSATIETRIEVPVEVCFDLARDVGAHAASAAFSGERIVEPGRTAGLLEAGDRITFEGRHFGIRQRLTAEIVEMDRPRRFVDAMVRGAFRSLRHVHEFQPRGKATLMRDVLTWEAPLGLLGRLADRLFLERHMEWFVRTKQQRLKQIAERSRV
ncbi:MAG TPA: SRPBCC family protein [Thermoanaerobaculia bacterium]|nr:SRPBCC family protein [Thermoanaerobaculia bacterium]